MRTPSRYEIPSLDLSSTEYAVEQTGTDGHRRPEYEARDVTGETVFEAVYEMYESPDAFVFRAPVGDEGDGPADGEELFRVTAEQTVDVAGEYVLTDAGTGEAIVVLDDDLSLVQDSWRLRDPEDGSTIATIESRGGPVSLARTLLPAGRFLGHRFTATDAEGAEIGSIESGFAVFDEYAVTIGDASSVPPDPIVAAAVVIDGIGEH